MTVFFVDRREFLPQPFEFAGENVHPDTFIDGENLWVIYQERLGENEPWKLRYAKYEI